MTDREEFAAGVRVWLENPRTHPHRRTVAALELLGKTTTDEMIDFLWEKYLAERDTDEEEEDASSTHASSASETLSEEIAELKRLMRALTTLVVSQHEISEARWEELRRRSRVESDEVSRQAEEKEDMLVSSIQKFV